MEANSKGDKKIDVNYLTISTFSFVSTLFINDTLLKHDLQQRENESIDCMFY